MPISNYWKRAFALLTESIQPQKPFSHRKFTSLIDALLSAMRAQGVDLLWSTEGAELLADYGEKVAFGSPLP